ncbi:MAG: hypothetical protein ACRDXX_04515, partial [Stackebrandtia sp.]
MFSPRTSTLRRRCAFAVAFLLLFGALSTATASAGAEEPDSGLVSLGVPMSYATAGGGAVGEAADGSPEIYTVAARDNDMGVF